MNVFSGKAISITIVFVSYCLFAHAQLNVPKHELGITAGMFIYQGDLTPESAGAFKSPGIAVNLFYNRLLSPSFSLRTNLAFGKLKADDANYGDPSWRKQRALAFTARTTELSELLVWNILANNYGDKHKISPYIFGGIGLNSLRITRNWSRFNYDYFAGDSSVAQGLAADTLHSVPGTIPVIPFGGGVRYAISSRISLTAEASYRFTFTDYIDGFSKVAKTDKKDYYSSYSIGIIYTFNRNNNTLKCPPMRY